MFIPHQRLETEVYDLSMQLWWFSIFFFIQSSFVINFYIKSVNEDQWYCWFNTNQKWKPKNVSAFKITTKFPVGPWMVKSGNFSSDIVIWIWRKSKTYTLVAILIWGIHTKWYDPGFGYRLQVLYLIFKGFRSFIQITLLL